MTLEEGVYQIPDCLRAVISKNTVKVFKRKVKEPQEVRNCGKCIHQKLGRKTMLNQWYDSPYCEMKPKTINGKLDYFYSAHNTHPACGNFEKREG